MTGFSEKIAANITGGRLVGGAWQALRVEIDSRRIKPGDLLVAIKGERFDGHDFIKEAFDKGAVAAVVSRVPKDVSGNMLVVRDTLVALEELGCFARQDCMAKIVGVTGSIGKTSTKEMIRLALSAHGKVYATSGNFNNHIGTPLTLANMPLDTDFGVFEMGMNHEGEIAHLTKMVTPDIAVITGVEAVHLEFFESVEAIADAKAEIFEGMTANGTAVLNADNAYYGYLKQIAARYGVECIGCGEGADCRVVSYQVTAGGCEVEASIFGKNVRFTLGAVGRHWAQVALMALATAHALELDVAKAAKALSAFSEPQGRGQVVQRDGITIIDDSYNASPASMRAAFAKAAEVWKAQGGNGRKIAVLGEMLELGREGPALHAALAKDLEANGFDVVMASGEGMKALYDVLPQGVRGGHAAKALELLPVLAKKLKPGDVVLLKGSHGSKIYELAAELMNVKEKTDAV